MYFSWALKLTSKSAACLGSPSLHLLALLCSPSLLHLCSFLVDKSVRLLCQKPFESSPEAEARSPNPLAWNSVCPYLNAWVLLSTVLDSGTLLSPPNRDILQSPITESFSAAVNVHLQNHSSFRTSARVLWPWHLVHSSMNCIASLCFVYIILSYTLGQLENRDFVYIFNMFTSQHINTW